MNALFESVLLKRSFRLAVGTLFTVVIVGLAWPHLSGEILEKIASRVDWKVAFLALGAYLIVNGLRALRFIAAGARLGFGKAFFVASVHNALLRVMPFRSGELAYGVLLKRMGGGGFGEGMAELLMLRILDLATVVPLSAVVAFEIIFETDLIGSFTAMFTAGVFLVVAFFALGPLLGALSARFSGEKEGKSLRNSIVKGLRLFAKTCDLRIKRKLVLIGLTLANWFFVILWLNLLILAVGASNNVAEGFLASVLGVAGSVLPLSLVGSFGPLEGGFAFGLSAIGKSSELAAAGAIMVSALSFLCSWVVALPAWFIMAAKGLVSFVPGTKDEKSPTRVSPVAACFAIGGGVLLLFRFGYGFETNDQFQYFMLPYRSIYENFLPGDWFTWQTSHYHVVFSFFIRALHAVSAESGFSNAVFIAHLFVLTAIAYSFYRLAKAVGWHWLSALIGLLIISFVRQMGIAGAMVNHGVLLPADMALAPLLLGLACLVEGRSIRAGLWLGLSGFIHANFAVIGPLLVAPIVVAGFISRRDLRAVIKIAAAYLILAWPALIIIVKSFLFSDPAPGGMEVMFNVRSPHHYNPPLLGSVEPWWLIALIVAGLPALIDRGEKPPARIYVGIMASLVGFLVLAGFATVFQWKPLIRLFLWRLSSPLMILGAVATGEMIIRSIKTRKIYALLYAFAAALVVASFSTKGAIKVDDGIELRGFAILLPCLIPLIACAVITRYFKKPWAGIVGSAMGALVLAWVVFVTVPNSMLLQKYTVRWNAAFSSWSEFAPLETEAKKKRDRKSGVYDWIRKNTPQDALFLTPPGLNDFRMRARRGVFVDWKCCPMKGIEAIEWRRRMLKSMGVKKFRAKGYALYDDANRRYYRQPLERLEDLAREEGLSHIMTSSRARGKGDGLERLVTKGRFVVYAVKE